MQLAQEPHFENRQHKGKLYLGFSSRAGRGRGLALPAPKGRLQQRGPHGGRPRMAASGCGTETNTHIHCAQETRLRSGSARGGRRGCAVFENAGVEAKAWGWGPSAATSNPETRGEALGRTVPELPCLCDGEDDDSPSLPAVRGMKRQRGVQHTEFLNTS